MLSNTPFFGWWRKWLREKDNRYKMETDMPRLSAKAI
jgi:hypothetical protein